MSRFGLGSLAALVALLFVATAASLWASATPIVSSSADRIGLVTAVLTAATFLMAVLASSTGCPNRIRGVRSHANSEAAVAIRNGDCAGANILDYAKRDEAPSRGGNRPPRVTG